MVSQPHKGRYRSWMLDIALAAMVLAAVFWWQARTLVSGLAPQLQGTMIDGHPVDESVSPGAADGRPALVHFWAIWCPVCRFEQGAIAAIAADHPVITVATQSGDAEDLRAYLKTEGIHLPVLPDPDGTIASAWGVSGVPASFVVDGTGRIRFATAGLTSETGLRLRLWAAERLQ